jgi:hypothetical protein
VRGTDVVTNTESPVSRNLWIDNLPPTVAITDSAQYTNVFTVAWSGSDIHSDLNRFRVDYKREDALSWILNWSTALVTSKVFTSSQDDTYLFRAWAYDNAGNSSVMTATVVVTTGGPQIKNPSPVPDTAVPVANPLIQADFISPSPITTFTLTLDGQPRSPDWDQNGFTYTTPLTEGLHHVWASVTNASGKSGTRDDWSFTVDTVTPTLALTVRQTTGPNLALAWPGHDPDPSSGDLRYDVQYKVGASPAWIAWLTNVAITNTTFVGSLGQSYTFQARVRDRAGNPSAWISRTVTIENVTKYYHFGGQRRA